MSKREWYRPEIDGLRAIAVAVVIAFHAGLGLPGGFIGVDVFFVISGYLITSIIEREVEEGRFTLSNFWDRRIRRVLPAATLTILLTLIAAYYVMLSDDFRSVGRTAVSQAFSGSNLLFWKTINYFTDTAAGLPLLHTWSLAVEEQFYLLYPIGLLVCYRITSRRGVAVGTILAVGALASLALCAALTYWRPRAAFFLLPTRAWELLLGALLVYWDRTVRLRRRAIREGISLLGLALIVASTVLISESVPFPGLYALVPCGGAALIIFANSRQHEDDLTASGAMLATRPMVFIGLISYSLYLFHWPILVFSRYWMGRSPTTSEALIAILLTVLVSWLSWKLVEQPLRGRGVLRTKSASFTFAAAAILAVAFTGLMAWKVVPGRYESIEALVNRDSRNIVDDSVDVEVADIATDRVSRFGSNRPGAIDLLLLGDSHARAAIPGFDLFARSHDLRGASITHSALQPLAGYRDPSRRAMVTDSIEWMNAALDFAARHRIGMVVLAAKWDDAFTDVGTQQFQELLTGTIERFQKAGANVWVMLSVPVYESAVPRLLVKDKAHPSAGLAGQWRQSPQQYDDRNAPLLSLQERLRAMEVGILDPRPYMLDGDTAKFLVEQDGASMYSDASHLTIPAAARIVPDMLENQLYRSP
ncbi:MAG: acyltransferase [Planctomycetales bacterium]|nr:acyltransferase [Planctomycetales bacterium]